MEPITKKVSKGGETCDLCEEPIEDGDDMVITELPNEPKTFYHEDCFEELIEESGKSN